jgi:hypothetical protein
MFLKPFQSGVSTDRFMWAGLLKVDWFPCDAQSVCKHAAAPFRHAELAQFAAQHSYRSHVSQSIASRRLPGGFPLYTGVLAMRLEEYEQLVVEYDCAVLKAVRSTQIPRIILFLGYSTQWVETARYLGVALVHRLPCRHTSTTWERKQLSDWACWDLH